MAGQSSREASGYLWWNIMAGLVFAAAALLAIPLLQAEISQVLDNEEGQVTWATLAGGVFVTGCFFWWRLMSRPQRFTAWRGAVAGAFVAIFSYPVVFLLAEFVQSDWRAAAPLGTLGERLSNVGLITALALLTSGFAAIIVLGLAGALFAEVERRLNPAAAAATASPRQRRRGFFAALLRITGFLAIGVLAVLAGVVIIFSLVPLDTEALNGDAFPPHPAQNYDAALAAYAQVQAEEAALPLNPRCHSALLTHGQKTARVVVFLHGLTNCPAQADMLGKQFFDLGYNVYIPRLPGHGEADVLTLALEHFTAEDLLATTARSIDLAQGLGDEVVVTGLSLGGTAAGWAAQYRADTANAVPLAPFFNPHVVPGWASHAATALILALPNFMVWWDPREPMAPSDMDYAYPRYATHALGQTMRLGQAIAQSACDNPAKASRLGMLLNAADTAVSNNFALGIADAWRGHGQNVVMDELPLWRQLPHDIIDPRQQAADIAYVYPRIIALATGTPPPAEPPAPSR